ESFDVVISECSFCTFPDKGKAAQEMARVLHRHGQLGMTDVTISRSLPEDVQSLLTWVACLTGAGSPDLYVSILSNAGFTEFLIEDKRDSLLEMVNNIRRSLLGIELAVGIRKLELGDLDLAKVKSLAQRAKKLIDSGVIGYTLFKANK
ncbi:unnamed protein product, partial [marine sediment metagenome]